MEWIRISNNKLKIMLTAQDAKKYDLRCESADYADVVTRQAFREILTDVGRETGFDATEDKVYIQMYPSKEGGCELFVTRVGLALGEEAAHSSRARHTEGRIKRADTYKKRSNAFLFTGLGDLLAACKRLEGRHFAGESEAWRDEDGGYWLFLAETGDPLCAEEDYRFIREYGSIKSADAARLYLAEHGHPVCRTGAVSTLAPLS